MSILITGANGQLGSEIRELVGTSQNRDADKYIFTDVQELDITDQAAVRDFVRDNHVELLVNCAAYTAVDRAESDLGLCHRLNAEAPRLLAEAMESQQGAIIHVSTDYVFDGTAHTPYREDNATNPQTAYGRTKLLGEQAVAAACRSSVILRTAWLYSAYGNNFVKTMLRLGREREQLGVIYDQIGTPTYARDLAAAILHIAERGIVPGTYHYTNEGVCSWYDFTCEIMKQAAEYYPEYANVEVMPVSSDAYPTKAKRPSNSRMSKDKLDENGFDRLPTWQDALKRYLKELKDNEQF